MCEINPHPFIKEFVRGGELFTHLCKQKKFDLPTARVILAEIAVALENVHRAGVIYRDLYDQNTTQSLPNSIA